MNMSNFFIYLNCIIGIHIFKIDKEEHDINEIMQGLER